MYEGFLELDGTEIVNSERARSYGLTADCPMTWFTGDRCTTLAAATFEPGGGYDYSSITDAPWYDALNDDLSQRFYGVFGLAFTSVMDSTRSAQVTQRLGGGGKIGRVRKGTKRLMVRALLAGRGRDAIDYGQAWLSAVLDNVRCVDNDCEPASLRFFAACPPERGNDVTYTDWATTATNAYVNPSFEANVGIPSGAERSSAWAASGEYSLHVLPPSDGSWNPTLTIVTLTNQTVIITPRYSNQTIQLADGASVATTAGVPVRLSGTGPVVLSQGWWDDLAVTEADYAGGYFDGGSEAGELVQYAWTGAANGSTSIRQERSRIETPWDDPRYLEQVQRAERWMHRTKAVSGPYLVEEMESRGVNAYIVEFVLESERSGIYGSMRRLPSQVMTPTVVDDIPVNLIPYPSVEISGGTVEVARNYALNPSAETDVSGWSQVADGTGITTGVVVSRSTAIASVGVASVRTQYTAPSAVANPASWMGCQQEVAIPDATRRYSINGWSTAQVQSGTATLGLIQITAYWRAAGSTLRTDVIGTMPAAGGALSLANILPPPGATSVIVRFQVFIPSFASGAVVNLYTDALAVTNP